MLQPPRACGTADARPCRFPSPDWLRRTQRSIARIKGDAGRPLAWKCAARNETMRDNVGRRAERKRGRCDWLDNGSITKLNHQFVLVCFGSCALGCEKAPHSLAHSIRHKVVFSIEHCDGLSPIHGRVSISATQRTSPRRLSMQNHMNVSPAQHAELDSIDCS